MATLFLLQRLRGSCPLSTAAALWLELEIGLIHTIKIGGQLSYSLILIDKASRTRVQCAHHQFKQLELGQSRKDVAVTPTKHFRMSKSLTSTKRGEWVTRTLNMRGLETPSLYLHHARWLG
ncbi:hypothetical protein K458DRAFT_61511 [Lentithecium fluviatile CBS 122367]|uniref:Uncharacterized protein n=1 Tax=Lentithecium fluviatile CBS 122367 TaxID=1168545 RepID=A0A6G1JKI3_9PLEO|nr:hypothetical protein K458DRAFT_61511 [Lentithecium fluviatile CBS 122367]